MKRLAVVLAGLWMAWLAVFSSSSAASGGPVPPLDRQKHARVKTATFACG